MPDTVNYLMLGLAAVFVIMALLIGSFWLRFHNLRQDHTLLEQLEAEN